MRELLLGWGVKLAAVTEGRVFVDRQRIDDLEYRLKPGNVLEVFSAPRGGGEVSIVERRGDIVVIDKPSGTASEPDEHGSGTSAREQVEAMLGKRAHAASRLDVGVSGLMTLTLTARAQRHLAEQRERGAMRRMYLGIAGATPSERQGTWSKPIVDKKRLKQAETRYRVAAVLDGSSCLMQLEPVTGRLHQLRRHAADAGAALVGDRRYGGTRRCTLANGQVVRVERVLLHSTRLLLEDETHGPWDLKSPTPPDFNAHYVALGGSGAADDYALWWGRNL